MKEPRVVTCLRKPRECIYNSQLKVKRVLTSNWKSYMYFDNLNVGQFIFDYLNLKVWELLELCIANPPAGMSFSKYSDVSLRSLLTCHFNVAFPDYSILNCTSRLSASPAVPIPSSALLLSKALSTICHNHLVLICLSPPCSWMRPWEQDFGLLSNPMSLAPRTMPGNQFWMN